MVYRQDPNAAKASPDDPQAKPRRGSASSSTGGGSKANSFDHGLRAKVVFSDEMAQAILERTRMLERQFLPVGEYEQSLINDMAVARVKLDIAADLLVANADRVASRARDFWDFDQRERALKLLRRLPKNPAYLAHKLAGTRQGAQLMIEGWEGLSHAALTAGDWDEAQRRLALDMLGTSLELRTSPAALPAAGDGAALAAVAASQVARLRTAIDEGLARQDTQDRADTIAGFRLADDDHSRLLRRYESLAQRDFNRAHAELVRAQEEAKCERDDLDDLFDTSRMSMADLLRAEPVKPHVQRVAEGMKARREAREAAAASAAPAGAAAGAGAGAGATAAEPGDRTSSPAPAAASAAGQTVPTAPAVEAAAPAAPASAPPAAPAAPDQPPPADDEPIKIGQGKSTPVRDLMRHLRKSAQKCASQPRRKGT
jgi:hypothetical protein